MTLDQWFAATGMKEEAFAATIGAPQPTVNRWRRGKREPRLRHAIRIVEATGGAVAFADLVVEAER